MRRWFEFGLVCLRPNPRYSLSPISPTLLPCPPAPTPHSPLPPMTHPTSPLFKPPGQAPTYQVLGDLYIFQATGVETNQAYALIEIQMQPHSGTPLHRHSREAESFYVQSGQIEVQLGESIRTATSGTFLHIPIGQWHRLTNTSKAAAHLLCWVTPAGAEQFFMAIGEKITAGESAPGAEPLDLNHILATASQYGIEISPPPESSPAPLTPS